MQTYSSTLLLLGALLYGALSHAVPVTIEDAVFGTPILIGSTGIEANDTTYNVDYQDGSYTSLYLEGSYDVVFDNKAEADNALRALIEDTFMDQIFGEFPNIMRGCLSNSTCRIFTVYGEQSGDTITTSVFVNQIGNADLSMIDLSAGAININTTTGAPISGAEQVFALWSFADPANGGNDGSNGGDDGQDGGDGGQNEHPDQGNNGDPVSVDEPHAFWLLAIGLFMLLLYRGRAIPARIE